MTFDEAIDYMNEYQCLPLCKHGSHLIDWGRELLAPPCGCSLTPDAADFNPRPGTLDYWASVTSKNSADDESR